MKKKLNNLILITLIFIIGIKSVNATSFTVGTQFTKKEGNLVRVEGLSDYPQSSNYSLHNYYFNNTYVGYCLDPHKDASSNYTIDRILGQGESSDRLKGWDYGLLEILKQGYNQINPSASVAGVSGDQLYAATSIAMRAHLFLYGYGGDISTDKGPTITASYIERASAHVNIGIDWAAKKSTTYNVAAARSCPTTSAEATNCYQNIMAKTYSWYNKNAKFTGTSNVLNAAEYLFNQGIEAAASYMRGEINEPDVTLKITNKEISERTETQTIEYIYAQFTIKDINDTEGDVKNVQTTCETCSSKGISIDTMEYQNESGEWLSFNYDTDISDLVPEENGVRNGNLKIRLKVTKDVTNDDDCSSADFKITYNYNDPSKEYIGAILKDNNTPDRQRFLIITKIGEDGISGEAKGTISCAQAACDTIIEVPVCSDNEEEAIAKVVAPENIKKCIIDNIDDANNSYQLSDGNGGISNSYCKIFCKEDYAEIKLNPIVEDVVCGGYFQLKAHVAGSKDCYTGGDTADKSINIEQYNADIADIQEKMVTAYNNVLLLSPSLTANGQSVNCNTDTGQCTLGNEISYLKSFSGTSFTINGITFTKSSSICKDTNGTTTSGLIISSSDKTYYNSHYGNYTLGLYNLSNNNLYRLTVSNFSGIVYEFNSESEEYEAKDEYFVEISIDNINKAYFEKLEYNNLSSAQNALSSAKTNYDETIKSINACTTGWTNEFLFNQQLKYYYNEYHYNTPYEPYYSLLAKAGDEQLYFLEKDGESITNSDTITVCLGDTNDNYECEGDSLVLDGSVDGSVNEYNYNSAYDQAFTTKQYITCSYTTDTTISLGCSTDSQQISQAKFVKKSVEKEQNYITPSAYYQIAANGKITVNSGYTGDAVQLEQLLNKLPVSTKTTGGGIFKLLLEDLGEFYNNGELGRLIDFQGEHEDDSVAKAVEGVGTYDGDYTCYYYSLCMPKECPNCEFVCEGDSCHWEECPSCTIECINCIFNLNELQLNFKTISTTNVASANREYGYNWITNTSIGQLQLVAEKAEKTISDIETANEMIYDKTGDSSALAFSIKLTPEIISELKDYNKDVEDEGGYANDSLTCYDYDDNGTTYKNIFCYSEVIDDLIYNHSDSITVYNRLDKNSNRETETSNSGYWTPWEGYIYNESVIGGPSWK